MPTKILLLNLLRQINANACIKLTALQEKILVELNKNSKSTQFELKNLLGKDIRTIGRNISTLKEKGVLKRIGSTKSGHWKIIKKQKNEKKAQ